MSVRFSAVGSGSWRKTPSASQASQTVSTASDLEQPGEQGRRRRRCRPRTPEAAGADALAVDQVPAPGRRCSLLGLAVCADGAELGRTATRRAPPRSKRALTLRRLAGAEDRPSGPNSFRPLHGAGLWLAVIWMPPAAVEVADGQADGRRRGDADVVDLAARGGQPGQAGVAEHVAAGPAVAADDDPAAATCSRPTRRRRPAPRRPA